MLQSAFCQAMAERYTSCQRAPASTADRGGRPKNPTSTLRRQAPTRYRRPKLLKPVQVIPRSSSEPALWTARFLPNSGVDGEIKPCSLADFRIARSAFVLPGLQACSDAPSPSPPRRCDLLLLDEGAKVVVSVTVEGSPGPVRTMVKVGASVEEAIEAVVDKYVREGRTPLLERGAAASFQLHHSHFSLQSLSKSDKIGEVGGRSFYLRTGSGSNSFHFGREDSDQTSQSSDIKLENGSSPTPSPPHFFIAFIVKRLKKIGRRTRKLCKLVACIVCI